MEYAEDADEEGDDTGSGDSDGGDQPLKKMRSNKLEVIWTGQKWYPDCVGMFAGFGNADLQRRPGFAGIARALNSKHSDEICAVHRRTDVVINANHVTSLYNRWVALTPAARVAFNPDIGKIKARQSNAQDARTKKSEKVEEKQSVHGQLKSIRSQMQRFGSLPVSQQYFCFEGKRSEALETFNTGRLNAEQASEITMWTRTHVDPSKADLERATEFDEETNTYTNTASFADVDLLQA